MKKHSVLLFVFLILSTILGCEMFGGGEVDLVKNGTLEIDKSLTVGKAIDNYKYFKKTEWKLVTTDNGKKIVEVVGNIDTSKHPTLNSNAGIKSMHIKFQFKLNQDKTFEVSWCGIGAAKNDGSKIEEDQNIEILKCLNSLKAIYDNKENI